MNLPDQVTQWPEHLAEIDATYHSRRQALNQQADSLLAAATAADAMLAPSATWLHGAVTEAAERLAQSRAVLPVVAARLRQAVEDRFAVEKEHVAAVVALVEAARPAAVEARKLMDAELPAAALANGAAPAMLRNAGENQLAAAAGLTNELAALRVVEAAVAMPSTGPREAVAIADVSHWLRHSAPEARRQAAGVDPLRARLEDCKHLRQSVVGG